MAGSTVAARRSAGLGIAAGVLAGVLAACGGGGNGNGDGDGAAPPRQEDTGATTVTVDMTDFRLDLSTQSFTAGDHTFVAKNSGSHEHALEIEGPGGEQKTRNLQPGESANLDVTLKDGTYKVYCPVDGHADLGMETEITVGGGSSGNDGPTGPDGY
ncbi:cupredoxin domain-containing protein [Streptomyces sp. KR80]|uniref:cupredoxin domain-containing protein n=1 Tax=Streptomyces sp. KR80 TaxID=3457426 RepID=UPI003FD5E841